MVGQIEGLTPKEFDLLHTLSKSPKQVFSREQLLQLVWDYEYYGDERTVDAHIKNYAKSRKSRSANYSNCLGRRLTSLMIRGLIDENAHQQLIGFSRSLW